MLVRPKFKIMSTEQAREYYSRILAHSEEDKSNGKNDSFYIRKIKEINDFVKYNCSAEEAVIELSKVWIGEDSQDDLKEIETGVYIGEWLNINHDFDYKEINFVDFSDLNFKEKNIFTSYPSDFNYKIPFDFGVCDTPEQLLTYKYVPGDWGRYILNKKRVEITPELEMELETEIALGEYLKNSNRKFAVGFYPIRQNYNGGWRWHKWGQYIGKHDIQCEYLDDEDLSDINQDFILCFHIYEFKDAEPVEDK